MNLNQIHEGEDYAWFEYRGRGENYRRNGRRLKIIRTFKHREWGNTKETGYVEGFLLDNETGDFKIGEDGQPKIVTARARDIAIMWEEYEDERDRQETLRIKREEEYERQRVERERLRKERAERERIEYEERERLAQEERERVERERVENEKKLLTALKEKYGIADSNGAISIAIGPQMVTVYFDKNKLLGGDEIAR